MPLEFNLVQRPDLQQRLSRGLNIIGEKSPARTLDPTIQATVILEDLTKQGSPFESPVDRRAWGSSGPIAGVAGELGKAAVVNPASSGIIIAIDWYGGYAAATAGIILGRLDISGLLPLANGDFSDTRHGPNSVIQIYTGTDPGSTLTAEFGRMKFNSTGAGTSFYPLPPIIVQPGENFGIESVVAATEVGFFFSWVEYTP